MGLEGGLLKGKILLNLDTEEDNELTIGCAGGVDVTVSDVFDPDALGDDMTGYRIVVRGLKGGHSGVDIHLGRGNANKLMNRMLWNASKAIDGKLRVAEIDGGGLRNAIPRESFAVVAIPKDAFVTFEEAVAACKQDILAEYAVTTHTRKSPSSHANARRKRYRETSSGRFWRRCMRAPMGFIA